MTRRQRRLRAARLEVEKAPALSSGISWASTRSLPPRIAISCRLQSWLQRRPPSRQQRLPGSAAVDGGGRCCRRVPGRCPLPWLALPVPQSRPGPWPGGQWPAWGSGSLASWQAVAAVLQLEWIRMTERWNNGRKLILCSSMLFMPFAPPEFM